MASSSAAFFSSITASGRPLTNTTMSGRRLCWPSITVNWFTASQSLLAASSKSISCNAIPGDGAVLAPVLDLHAIPQHPVEDAVGSDERRRVGAQHFAQGLLARFLGNVGIQPVDGLAQPSNQHHSSKESRSPPARRGRCWAVTDPVAQFLEPGQGGVFDGGFVELVGHSGSRMARSCVRLRHRTLSHDRTIDRSSRFEYRPS